MLSTRKRRCTEASLRRQPPRGAKRRRRGGREPTVLACENLLDVFSTLNRPTLDTLQLASLRFDGIVTEKMQEVCLRNITRMSIAVPSILDLPWEAIIDMYVTAEDEQGNPQSKRVRGRLEHSEKIHELVQNVLCSSTITGMITMGRALANGFANLLMGPSGINCEVAAIMKTIGRTVAAVGELEMDHITLANDVKLKSVLRSLMPLQRLQIKHCNGINGVDDGLLKWCCRKGIARISLEHVGNTRITGAGILGFCFGGKDPGDYTRYLHLLGDDYLEEYFFDKLIEAARECGHVGGLKAEIGSFTDTEFVLDKYKDAVTTRRESRGRVVHKLPEERFKMEFCPGRSWEHNYVKFSRKSH
ncbi:hypothetical protein AAVH_18812 [Aphelenchoides avenae]|nr:hypothetical protein AAVH_18812 [Aphelenchus avenae]